VVGDDDRDLEATIQSNEPGGRSEPGCSVDVSVIVLSGAERGAGVPLRGKVHVGKAPENDLVLSEESVSRQHCEITRVPGGIRIRDLGSTNGTFVEHARITDATTPVGSVVRVGNSVELALRPDLELLAIEPFPHDELEGVIGSSVAMRRIFRVLDGVAKTEATVLLHGETGTGKEVLARAIVRRSLRAEPFVVVDCGSVTHTLIQSELFGHERGAFTGAIAQRKGAFESADGGTIFLDEIGELPLDVQPMLLRVLEAREFRRVGGNQTLKADVRVIAATSRDLEREVSAGKFREDLYFRLAVVPVRIPPLRARREDIPALAPWSGCSSTTGRATCASCGTSSSGRRTCPRRRGATSCCCRRSPRAPGVPRRTSSASRSRRAIARRAPVWRTSSSAATSRGSWRATEAT
jgi:hypothetical protein